MEQNNNAFLFKLFLRNSYLAVAGGMAIIPPIEKEIIKRGLMSDDELGEMAATAAAMPGMFAFNYCACLGRRLNGTAGSAVAVAGIALPALVVLLVLVLLFGNIAVGKGFESFLKGVRPAVVAMFAWPCIRLGRAAKINLSNLVIPLAAALAIWLMHISPFYIIVAVAVCGFVYGKFIQPN